MKKMKKLVAFLLATVMVLGMSMTALATQGTNDNTTGKITISNATEGETYSIYQILVLESYNSVDGAYSYKVASGWENFVGDNSCLTVDNSGYVKWTGGSEAAKVETFAKDALAYAKKNNIDPKASKVAGSSVVEFTSLNLGFYLIDSSMGTLCSLDTTHPEAVVEEKNTPPAVDKKVENDAGNFNESASKSTGEKVKFATKIDIYEGTQNLVYHDQMEDGFTFNMSPEGTDYVADTVTVYKIVNKERVGLTLGQDYSVVVDGTTNHDLHAECINSDEECINSDEECDFEVIFTTAFLDAITERTEIEIVYTATLNENAKIVGSGTPGENDANINDSKITYGEKSCSNWDDAKVYSFRFQLVKTDVNLKVLTGAEFKLYNAAKEGTMIPVKYVKTDEAGVKYYKVDLSATESDSDTIEAGNVMIEGLAYGTYYLEETKAPEGYNILTERVAVSISAATGSNTAIVTDNVYQSGGVKIENKSGNMMPATGGMGTTILYVVGGILVVGAVVVLVTRKRMSREA